jgi:uracil-DNA glycosylase
MQSCWLHSGHKYLLYTLSISIFCVAAATIFVEILDEVGTGMVVVFTGKEGDDVVFVGDGGADEIGAEEKRTNVVFTGDEGVDVVFTGDGGAEETGAEGKG